MATRKRKAAPEGAVSEAEDSESGGEAEVAETTKRHGTVRSCAREECAYSEQMGEGFVTETPDLAQSAEATGAS